MRSMLILNATLLSSLMAIGCSNTDFSSAPSRIAEQETQADNVVPEEPALAEAPTPEPPSELKKLPKIGLLVNDLQCGLCHVKIIGDVASTREVSPVWPGSNVDVAGAWFAAKAFKANDPNAVTPNPTSLGVGVTVNVSGGIKTDYMGSEVPPAFPAPAFTDLGSKMRGSVSASLPAPVSVDKVHTGNLVLVGTKDNPIQINSDVHVTGDLVIAGYYKGVGTIYVSGSAYIPADLMAVKSVFPYPDDATMAKAHALEAVKDKSYDGLGLVSKNSIFIGDLEKFEPGRDPTLSVYTHPSTPADRRLAALGVLNVYQWYVGGKAEFDKLYGSAPDCGTMQPRPASISLVESFLYAGNTIAGVARKSSYSIRGGVIADHFHIISGAQTCSAAVLSPTHGRPMNKNYIEYDFRLQTELFPLVEHIADK